MIVRNSEVRHAFLRGGILTMGRKILEHHNKENYFSEVAIKQWFHDFNEKIDEIELLVQVKTFLEVISKE